MMPVKGTSALSLNESLVIVGRTIFISDILQPLQTDWAVMDIIFGFVSQDLNWLKLCTSTSGKTSIRRAFDIEFALSTPSVV